MGFLLFIHSLLSILSCYCFTIVMKLSKAFFLNCSAVEGMVLH